ncbi:MAG: hypothetical protein FJ403_21195 [Verrucomicrobia bacterium]|nr:hypothetical protein [Verrucomicrobiota bacterium]
MVVGDFNGDGSPDLVSAGAPLGDRAGERVGLSAHGVENMRRRVSDLDGCFDLVTAPGKGTTLQPSVSFG